MQHWPDQANDSSVNCPECLSHWPRAIWQSPALTLRGKVPATCEKWRYVRKNEGTPKIKIYKCW